MFSSPVHHPCWSSCRVGIHLRMGHWVSSSFDEVIVDLRRLCGLISSWTNIFSFWLPTGGKQCFCCSSPSRRAYLRNDGKDEGGSDVKKSSTHLPLATCHGHIHESPCVCDSLLCAALGSLLLFLWLDLEIWHKRDRSANVDHNPNYSQHKRYRCLNHLGEKERVSVARFDASKIRRFLIFVCIVDCSLASLKEVE